MTDHTSSNLSRRGFAGGAAGIAGGFLVMRGHAWRLTAFTDTAP